MFNQRGICFVASFFLKLKLLNLSGFLLQNQCPVVAESAVIGYSHDIKGQGEQETFISV